MKPDTRVMRAMNLLKNPELLPFMDYLKAHRQEALEHMSNLGDKDMILRMQGKAQNLKTLIDEIEMAQKINPVRHTGNGV